MQQHMYSYICVINLRSEFQKGLSFFQIYFSRKIGVSESDRNVFIARKVNMTLWEYFLRSYLFHKRRNP